MKEKRKKLGRIGRWRKERRREWKEEEDKEWKKERNELFRMILAKKKEMLDSFAEEATDCEAMWGLWRMTSKNQFVKTPTLKHQETRAVSFEQKEELQRERLFPTPVEDNGGPREGNGNKRTVMCEAMIQRVFKAIGNFKAPGEDEIAVKAVKETMEEMKERIQETYQTATDQGRHPGKWKTAIAAIIPKPGKTDYGSVNSYRPVALLNVLGKGLEKMMAVAITERAEKDQEERFHQWQWGGRRGRGSEECVEVTVDWARKKMGEGKKVVIIMMDVAQAFPNVGKERLANRLRAMGMSDNIVEWVRDFMTKRTIKLRLDGEEGEWHEVEMGVPQGSPVSPVLFKVYIAPLLRHLESIGDTDMITPTFVNDVTRAIAADPKDEAIMKAEKAIAGMEDLAKQNGICFEKAKME